MSTSQSPSPQPQSSQTNPSNPQPQSPQTNPSNPQPQSSQTNPSNPQPQSPPLNQLTLQIQSPQPTQASSQAPIGLTKPLASNQEGNSAQILTVLIVGSLIGLCIGGIGGWFLGNPKENIATYRSNQKYEDHSQCPTLEDKLQGMEILSIQWEVGSKKCIYQYRVNVD